MCLQHYPRPSITARLSESACGTDFQSIHSRYCPHALRQESPHLTPRSLSCKVCKNTRMNSTLKVIPINAFIDLLFCHIITRGALNSFNGPWQSMQACTYSWQHDCVIIPGEQVGDKAQHSLLPNAIIYTAIVEFPCKISADIFPIDIFFTYSIIPVSYTAAISIYCCASHVSAVLNRLYSTFSVQDQSDIVQTPIKHSPLALNLPAFMPQALEMEKGPSLGHSAPCSHSKKLHCCPLTTHNSSVCTKHFSQQHVSDSGKRRGIIEVFIYFLFVALSYHCHNNRWCYLL